MFHQTWVAFLPTQAQEIAALKRAVREIEQRLGALEGPDGLGGIRQAIREETSNNDALFKVVLRRLEHLQGSMEKMQTQMDGNHAAVMAQFEKIHAKPSEQ
jgi:hypothetical protein